MSRRKPCIRYQRGQRAKLTRQNNQHKHSRTWHISLRLYRAPFVHMCCLLLLIVSVFVSMLNQTLRACHESWFALQPKQVSPSQTPFQTHVIYRNVSLYLGIVLSFAGSSECDFSHIYKSEGAYTTTTRGQWAEGPQYSIYIYRYTATISKKYFKAKYIIGTTKSAVFFGGISIIMTPEYYLQIYFVFPYGFCLYCRVACFVVALRPSSWVYSTALLNGYAITKSKLL